MPNEIRVRNNFIGGLVEDNPLTNAAVLLTSAGLAALPAIGTTQHAVIILDPDGLSGSPEIAYITSHTAAATTATILRGQEGTAARAHDRDVVWIHGATVKEFDGSGGGAGLIGLTSYSPAGATTPSNNTAAVVDVDAANLAVTFVTPPSGRVLVKLNAFAACDGGATFVWSLREGVVEVVGAKKIVASGVQGAMAYAVLMSGLTAGLHTYKWAHYADYAPSGQAMTTRYGGAYGQAIMEVWAVNV